MMVIKIDSEKLIQAFENGKLEIMDDKRLTEKLKAISERLGKWGMIYLR